MPTPKDLPRDIGEFIRDLRRNARISLRQLADQAGVSNPYLSQIERGLRRPSAEVLQQIASALRVSTPLMYLRAGLLDGKEGHDVLEAIAADPDLTAAQKQSLIQIYETFRRENAREAEHARAGETPLAGDDFREAETPVEPAGDARLDAAVTAEEGPAGDALAGDGRAGGRPRLDAAVTAEESPTAEEAAAPSAPEQHAPATNAAGKAATTKEI